VVRELSLDWLIHYNTVRPHDGLGEKTPYEFTNEKEN